MSAPKLSAVLAEPLKIEFIEEESWHDWRVVIRQCFAEFVGDILFIFVGCLSFTLPTACAGPIGAAFAHGLCISLLVISLGHISGGHFNPAVTLGVTVSGNMHPVLAGFYMLSQLLGGFVGALFVRGAVKTPLYMSIIGGTTNLDTTNATVGNAILTSIMTSYLLVQTVLCGAVDRDSNILAPLGIGFVVWIDILAAGEISGASMNPARSFGPAAAYSLFYDNSSGAATMGILDVWDHHYVHWLGPLSGGLIAGLTYRAILMSGRKRWLLRRKH